MTAWTGGPNGGRNRWVGRDLLPSTRESRAFNVTRGTEAHHPDEQCQTSMALNEHSMGPRCRCCLRNQGGEQLSRLPVLHRTPLGSSTQDSKNTQSSTSQIPRLPSLMARSFTSVCPNPAALRCHFLPRGSIVLSSLFTPLTPWRKRGTLIRYSIDEPIPTEWG